MSVLWRDRKPGARGHRHGHARPTEDYIATYYSALISCIGRSLQCYTYCRSFHPKNAWISVLAVYSASKVFSALIGEVSALLELRLPWSAQPSHPSSRNEATRIQMSNTARHRHRKCHRHYRSRYPRRPRLCALNPNRRALPTLPRHPGHSRTVMDINSSVGNQKPSGHASSE